ncbi:MAG: polymer-forming cytoskeletal protein [Lentimicrobiaceae bacterium]|nr:polymer-forming cytoskeletal protein [Lentimicrobiaceae bacterium]
MAKNYEPEEIGGINMIAAGTTLTGDLVSAGDCRIDGALKGNIISNSKIYIGKTGMIEGKIQCHSVEIEGQAKADIIATELLSLKASAVLTGNIRICKIAIEPGANFVGNCVMQNPAPAPPPEAEDEAEN